MINVSDLVSAVKEKKEKEFELFDKIDFICRTFGEKISEYGVDTYLYKEDNLRFSLLRGNLPNQNSAKNIIVQDLHTNFEFFNYFKDVSSNDEKAYKYISGQWEKLVEQHYKMALDNIE